MDCVTVLAEASLTDNERRVLDRLADRLADKLRPRLRSVWLYGSRARGEKPHAESDIDVLVIVDPILPNDELTVIDLSWEAADEEGPVSGLISTLVYSSDRLAQRREIHSFFIQEVDRDKIVLYGES